MSDFSEGNIFDPDLYDQVFSAEAVRREAPGEPELPDFPELDFDELDFDELIIGEADYEADDEPGFVISEPLRQLLHYLFPYELYRSLAYPGLSPEAAEKLFYEDLLSELLSFLKEREQAVMIYLLGLEDGQNRSIDETARHFSISPVRVRLIQSKFFRPLRRHRLF